LGQWKKWKKGAANTRWLATIIVVAKTDGDKENNAVIKKTYS
jgi:hypothetical protein